MENYRIIMAQRRLNHGRLYGKQATKSTSDAVITQVTQATVEDVTEKADEIEEATEDVRSLQKSQAEWAKELGIPKQTLTKYMKKHECTLEEAVEYYKSR